MYDTPRIVNMQKMFDYVAIQQKLHSPLRHSRLSHFRQRMTRYYQFLENNCKFPENYLQKLSSTNRYCVTCDWRQMITNPFRAIKIGANEIFPRSTKSRPFDFKIVLIPMKIMVAE